MFIPSEGTRVISEFVLQRCRYARFIIIIIGLLFLINYFRRLLFSKWWVQRVFYSIRTNCARVFLRIIELVTYKPRQRLNSFKLNKEEMDWRKKVLTQNINQLRGKILNCMVAQTLNQSWREIFTEAPHQNGLKICLHKILLFFKDMKKKNGTYQKTY